MSRPQGDRRGASEPSDAGTTGGHAKRERNEASGRKALEKRNASCSPSTQSSAACPGRRRRRADRPGSGSGCKTLRTVCLATKVGASKRAAKLAKKNNIWQQIHMLLFLESNLLEFLSVWPPFPMTQLTKRPSKRPFSPSSARTRSISARYPSSTLTAWWGSSRSANSACSRTSRRPSSFPGQPRSGVILSAWISSRVQDDTSPSADACPFPCVAGRAADSDVLLEITAIERANEHPLHRRQSGGAGTAILAKHLPLRQSCDQRFHRGSLGDLPEHRRAQREQGISLASRSTGSRAWEEHRQDRCHGCRHRVPQVAFGEVQAQGDLEAIEKALLEECRAMRTREGHGLAAVRRFAEQWQGRLSIRSGTAGCLLSPNGREAKNASLTSRTSRQPDKYYSSRDVFLVTI